MTKIIGVETRDGAQFLEGPDYRLEDGLLILPGNGSIPLVSSAQLYAEDGSPRISEDIQDLQLRVTYVAGDSAPPPTLPKPLPGLQKKLRTKNDPAYITFYGDSITKGWGADSGASFVERNWLNSSLEAVGMGEDGRFKRDMVAIIQGIRSRSPATEFVLVSGMRANPMWRVVDNRQINRFRDDMAAIQAATWE